MSVPSFVLVDVLLSYSAGFAAWSCCAAISTGLSPPSPACSCSCSSTGTSSAHYSVGHFTWGAYFLFPFVALLVCRFLDGDDSWRSVAMFAWLIFYMVLAGGQHHVDVDFPVPRAAHAVLLVARVVAWLRS
jgi:hypothetical protein